MTAFDVMHASHIEALRSQPATIDLQGLRLGAQYVMFFAEAELMRRHGQLLVANLLKPDVLEIGLGLGVFAEQLAQFPIASYTAIEPHPQVAMLARDRVLSRYPVPVRIVGEPWQLVNFAPESVDVIMYDTWPPDGCADADFAHFVEHVAVPALRPGGRFSFFHSGNRLSGTRQQILDRYFAGWTAKPYELPRDAVPTAWTKPSRDFLIPIASKGYRS
jgi:spermidine synthase